MRGEKYPYTSNSQKTKLVKAASSDDFDEKSMKAMEEIAKITRDLQNLAYRGDEKAMKELEKWNEITEKVGF